MQWDILIYPDTVSPFGSYFTWNEQYEMDQIRGIAVLYSRLWSLFGESSDYSDSEFDYYLLDNKLGIPICVDTSGSYWAQLQHHQHASEIQNVLDSVLEEADVSDCELVIFNSWKIGASNGIVFVESISDSQSTQDI